MRTYIYYGFLSPEQYKQLAASETKVVTTNHEDGISSRQKQKAIETAAHLFSLATNLAAVGVPHGPQQPKLMGKVIRGVSEISINAISNPANTLYTGDNNFRIRVNEKQIDLKNAEVYENGQQAEVRTWTDRLPTSQVILKAEKIVINPDQPNAPVMCFFVSPIPPEAVHQKHELKFGLVTRYKEDAEALATQDGFVWPAIVMASVNAQNLDELIERIPYELIQEIDPKKLGIDNEPLLIQLYQNLKIQYEDLVNRLSKVENENFLIRLARNFSSMIPFLRIGSFSKDDVKAYNQYQDKISLYKNKLKEYFSDKVQNPAQIKILHDMLEKCIQGKTFYDTIKHLDLYTLQKLDLHDLLHGFENHNAYEEYLGELEVLHTNLMVGNPDSDAELKFKIALTNTLLSLQKTIKFDDQLAFIEQIEKNLSAIIKKSALPSVKKFGMFSETTSNLDADVNYDPAIKIGKMEERDIKPKR